jgi:hypothetical protein
MRILEYYRNCLGYEFYYTALVFLAMISFVRFLMCLEMLRDADPFLGFLLAMLYIWTSYSFLLHFGITIPDVCRL